MKSILLAFGLVAVSFTATFAQATASAQASAQTQSISHTATVSKNDFNVKVGELNTIIGQNKPGEAKAKWAEVHNMMLSEFATLKVKIREATDANNETDKTHYIDVLQKQNNTYREIMKLKEDMIANKVQLNAKLNEYIAQVL